MSPEVAGFLTAVATLIAGVVGGRYALLAKRATAAVEAQAIEVEADKQEVAKDVAVLEGVQIVIDQLREQNASLAAQLANTAAVQVEATAACDRCLATSRALRAENADLVAAVKLLAADLRLADDWSLTDYARARWGGQATPADLHHLIEEAKQPRRRSTDHGLGD